MPARSKISSLPKAVQTWLNDALIEGNFSGYEALSAELEKQGYSIGKSLIGREALRIARRVERIKTTTEAAKMIAAASPDDEDAKSEAIISITQHELFEALTLLQEATQENAVERLAMITKAGKGIAEVVRASGGSKRFTREARNEARKEALSQAAAQAVTIARKGGASPELTESIKAGILGIQA